MNWITTETASRILGDLIEIPTINPMGAPYGSSEPVERKALGYIEQLFARYGVTMERQRCSPLHESLLISAPGRLDGGITLMEAHVDTVPADDWRETAFTRRSVGSRIYGRGACDDKGSLVSMLLALLDILERGHKPPYSIALLAAGDEEYAQTGIKHFAGLGYPVSRSVVGEPTSLTPIIQHKGTIRWDISVHGRSAHTSRPELGRNAITDAIKVIAILNDHQRELEKQFMNPLTAAPVITVTKIQGGRTRNAVPDECVLAMDFRVVPGMNPAEARQAVIDKLNSSGLDLSHSEVQLMTPPLDTNPDHPFSKKVLDICRKVTGIAGIDFGGAPYGTDAAWIASAGPSIVLGPGSIKSAHSIDEFVDVNEITSCARIYREIMMSEIQSE